jgi:hypothetical protein
MTNATNDVPGQPANPGDRRNRRVIHATCMHKGPIGGSGWDERILPEGVFHLLIVDDTIRQTYGTYITVCGEEVPASSLPPSCYDEDDCDFARNPAYCSECVREAARWNAEPSQARSASAARPPTDPADRPARSPRRRGG